MLFGDIVDFTRIASRTTPEELVVHLNEIFSAFDQLTDKHKLEKIKTIGDAYMVVGGLPVPSARHAKAVANMALDMLNEMDELNKQNGTSHSLRIGINSGAVVAGVIGKRKFIYDLWGDTVNIASRMESSGQEGKIHVSAATYVELVDKYDFEERGVIDVKGKGKMKTYWLVGKKSNS